MLTPHLRNRQLDRGVRHADGWLRLPTSEEKRLRRRGQQSWFRPREQRAKGRLARAAFQGPRPRIQLAGPQTRRAQSECLPAPFMIDRELRARPPGSATRTMKEPQSGVIHRADLPECWRLTSSVLFDRARDRGIPRSHTRPGKVNASVQTNVGTSGLTIQTRSRPCEMMRVGRPESGSVKLNVSALAYEHRGSSGRFKRVWTGFSTVSI